MEIKFKLNVFVQELCEHTARNFSHLQLRMARLEKDRNLNTSYQRFQV